jgi:hypothetical protein
MAETIRKLYTDYPLAILFGDKPRVEAPIREVKLLDFDGDKYCTVEVGGMTADIKFGYIYFEPKRNGAAPSITIEEINTILKPPEVPAEKKET